MCMSYSGEIELSLVVATNRGNKDFLGKRKQEKKITNNYWRSKNSQPQEVGLQDKILDGRKAVHTGLGRMTELSGEAFTQRSLTPCSFLTFRSSRRKNIYIPSPSHSQVRKKLLQYGHSWILFPQTLKWRKNIVAGQYCLRLLGAEVTDADTHRGPINALFSKRHFPGGKKNAVFSKLQGNSI